MDGRHDGDRRQRPLPYQHHLHAVFQRETIRRFTTRAQRGRGPRFSAESDRRERNSTKASRRKPEPGFLRHLLPPRRSSRQTCRASQDGKLGLSALSGETAACQLAGTGAATTAILPALHACPRDQLTNWPPALAAARRMPPRFPRIAHRWLPDGGGCWLHRQRRIRSSVSRRAVVAYPLAEHGAVLRILALPRVAMYASGVWLTEVSASLRSASERSWGSASP